MGSVTNCVVLSGSIIKKGAKVFNAVIAEDQIIEEGELIGSADGSEIYLVSEDGIKAE